MFNGHGRGNARNLIRATMACLLGLLMSCGGTGDASHGNDQNGASSNVQDDPSLAQYVCTKNLTTRPGKLKLLPVGTTGAPQARGNVEYDWLLQFHR